MKKNYLKLMGLLLLFSASAMVTNAQVKWGFEGGINGTTQSSVGNIYCNDDIKVGYNFGVTGAYSFNNWFALKSGLNFSELGKSCELKTTGSTVTDKYQYLMLPVKAEFSAGEKAGFKNGQRLFFATGPYAGYLLNAKQKTEGETTDLTNTNDFELGWSFELGYEIPVSKSNALRLSLNYDAGLKEVITDSDLYNKSASIKLGIIF